MKLLHKAIVWSVLPFLFSACNEDFLNEVPQGVLSEVQLVNSVEGVEALVIAAYSVLNGQIDNTSQWYHAPASNWVFGDVASDDAYKGGGGVADGPNIHEIEVFLTASNNFSTEQKWKALYEGIARCNAAMRAIQNFKGWDDAKKKLRLGEMRLLRGHYYFDLKKIYNLFPYVDETPRTSEDYKKISNREFSSEQLWQKIEEDFKYARDVLPDTQPQIGRVTKGAANAYLAKVYIFQKKWQETVDACNLVISSPYGYTLLKNFNDVFLPQNDNSKEIVFNVQYSINDGAANNGYNGSIGDRLINPGGPYFFIRGFLRPSQNMVNAYKTDSLGLPLLNTFNNVDLKNTDAIDPRLDHTIGRPGIPYLDLPTVYEVSWARESNVYGSYSAKKRVVSTTSPLTLTVNPWTHAMNFAYIRFADVLLWKAEALVELGKLEEARPIVNQIRRRARDGAYVQKIDRSGAAANYKMDEYKSLWTDQQLARNAVRFERRLELAHEGHRFFDLVRWGSAPAVINEYARVEKTKRTYLSAKQFKADKHEYYPIPQSQIDLTGGLLKQNTGY